MKKYIYLLTSTCLFISCGDVNDYKLPYEKLYERASSAAVDNNQIITSAEEIVDLTADVLISEGISISRVSGRSWGDEARSCNPSVDHSYLIDRTHYDTILYVGTMTLDYGTGESCIDADYKRKGKIIDDFEYILNYKKEIFLSKETITFDHFKKDSVQIDGKFLIHSDSGNPITLETNKATITYANGKSAVWKGALSFDIERSDGHATRNTINGSFEGITKHTERFTATITSPLVYNYTCDNLLTPIPVQGTIAMKIIGEQSIVDYGDGQCDKGYTLTVDGRETSLGL